MAERHAACITAKRSKDSIDTQLNEPAMLGLAKESVERLQNLPATAMRP